MKPQVGTEVQLTDDVDFEGTILVEGDLVFAGRGIVLTAVDGFPAVVITARVLIMTGSETTIDGLVVASGGIVPEDGSALGSSTTINGALIANWLGYDPNLHGGHELNYMMEKCRIYDFSSLGEGGDSLPPMKLLKYE